MLYQQYQTDKKSIHSLLISDSKELTDYDILDILNRLKLYHEKLDLFNNADEYVQVLGKYFTGLDSDWDNILRLVAICDSVQQQFKGQVSKKTAEALSCNHQEFNNAVSSLANKASTALLNVQNIVADNPFNPDLSASEIQTQEIVSTAAVLISLLNKISAQKTRIKTCLIQPDTGYEMIFQGVGAPNRNMPNCLIFYSKMRIPIGKILFPSINSIVKLGCSSIILMFIHF